MIYYAYQERYSLDREYLNELTNKEVRKLDATQERTNLETLLWKNHISTGEYAKRLGVVEKSVNNKLRGRTQFTLEEVFKTSEIFPEYTLEYLFDGYGKKTKVETGGEE